jgi:2-polyprenyl-6-methoxyphenol hydroxylase-like FAD-dependent oxidoreductase
MTSPRDGGVLVVGAGPVGLSAALLLARHGVPVRVVDQNDGPTDLSKALVVWKRTMDTVNPVLPHARFTDGHPTLRQAVVGFGGGHGSVVRFPRPDHGAPSSAMIPQSATERLLLQRLHEFGVDVERHTELVQFVADGSGVTCTLRSPGGSSELRCDWLLGCDGSHSRVRRGLGIPFPGSTEDRRWMLADFEVAGPNPPAADEVVIQLARGVNAAFPMGGARWRLIADLGAGQGTGAELRTPTRDDIQHTLDERTDLGWQIGDVHWTSEFGVNERQVERYVHGRVVLIGDAAHVHSPAGGQGMNTGIQDAANVAWKIALVQRGAASEALVSTYDSERHPIGKQVVRNTAALLKLAMVGGPVKVIRDRVLPVALSLPALQHAVASFLMEESINYRNGPLADGSRRDGIRSGDGWPLSAGAQAELVLVGTFDRATTPATFGGPNGFPLTVTTLTPEDPRAARLAHRNTAALVRPDGVVASVGEDIGAVMSWQSRLSLEGTVPRPLAA